MKKLITLLLAIFMLVGCQTENIKPIKDENTKKNIENREEKKEEKEGKEEITFDLSKVKFKDESGKEYKISDFKGKIVGLNFFQTTCVYCKREMPEFEEIMKEDKEVLFLPVDVGESVEKVKNFMEEKELTMKPYFDFDMELASMFSVTGFPTTVYFDKEGKMLGIVPGYQEKETVLDLIKAIKEGRVEPVASAK